MQIRREHKLGKAEVRQRVDDIAASLCVKYNLRSSWQGDHLKFTGSGVNGRISVDEQSIDVDVKLGMALMMLKGTIKSTIEGAMDKHLK